MFEFSNSGESMKRRIEGTWITLYLQQIKIRQTCGKEKYSKTINRPTKKSYLKTSKNLNASFQTKSGIRATLQAITHSNSSTLPQTTCTAEGTKVEESP